MIGEADGDLPDDLPLGAEQGLDEGLPPLAEAVDLDLDVQADAVGQVADQAALPLLLEADSLTRAQETARWPGSASQG